MKKSELVYNEIFCSLFKERKTRFTQLELSKNLSISLSTVNNALKPLRRMNAINVSSRSFTLVNKKKILLYWASIRNLEKDVIYKTRVENIIEAEKNMPEDVIFTAYSGYKFYFKDAPADYSEIYVYTNDLNEIRKRFPEKKQPYNLFLLKAPSKLRLNPAMLFVDLWNLKEWYAKDFLKALEVKVNGILE
ncbi:hypothetical protein HYV88_06340 [Candidatus Woesearchaeota archaeon]|nr:hypothetical protein [Candidatus Woesearchaeota archaeon]